MVVKGIKSFSDVITNSSSEVFVMEKSNAEYYDNLKDTGDCINIEEINWDWVHSERGRWEWEMVCNVCGLDEALIRGEYHASSWGGGYYSDPSQEDWEEFCNMNKETIEKKLIGLYWVDIEDHFADACDVSEEARDDSKWNDYRH